MIFPLSSPLKILKSNQILLKQKCGVDEYLCLPCVGTKNIKAIGKWIWRRLFSDTVCMEFRVCFITAKYENDIFSLCETSNAFIDAFCYSKIHFHQSGPFTLIKTILKSLHGLFGFISSMESLSKGSSRERDYQAFNNRV